MSDDFDDDEMQDEENLEDLDDDLSNIFFKKAYR